jgi:hypothetical protein
MASAPIPFCSTLTAPVVADTKRAFRLCDTHKRSNVPHRFYATERRALDSALLLVRWARVGCTLEVYDARGMRFIAAYSRHIDSILFVRGSR